MTPPECANVTAFRAMGSDCEIAVTDAHGTRSINELLAIGAALIHSLERYWSRFLSESDVTRVNRNAGRWVSVSQWTRNAMIVASTGRDLTQGRYNPLVGHHLVMLGYDRPFATLSNPHERLADAVAEARGDVTGDIDIDERTSRVRIPIGTQLDLGGIGKGYAGDVVTDALLSLGATGVMANLGGDVRVAGACSDHADHWSIQVGSRDEVILLDDGAVAFTTTDKRRWQHKGMTVHHLVDPATGSSLTDDVPMVCVVSSEGWWSEVLTKSVAVHLARQRDARFVGANLNSVVPSGAYATVEFGGMSVATDDWNSVSARYEPTGR